MVGFKYKKSVQALNFFALKEGGRINKMKALKLVWLSDRYHLTRYARLITDDTYFAMDYGPVASATKDLAEEASSEFLAKAEKEYRQQFLKPINNLMFESAQAVDQNIFSETDLEALEEIYKSFGGLDQFQLSDLSHSFPEWQKFEEKLKAGGTRFKMDYNDFFLKPANKNIPLFNKDVNDLARDIFIENQSIGNS
jgi:uncharacterized phage-associated protein